MRTGQVWLLAGLAAMIVGMVMSRTALEVVGFLWGVFGMIFPDRKERA